MQLNTQTVCVGLSRIAGRRACEPINLTNPIGRTYSLAKAEKRVKIHGEEGVHTDCQQWYVIDCSTEIDGLIAEGRAAASKGHHIYESATSPLQ